MMSHLLCHMLLLLVFLSSRDVMLVKASNDSIRCGNDNCCQAMGKLMTAVKEEEAACPVLSEKIDKQTKNLEQMKGKLDRRLASMSAISKQLERLSADLLQHDERLKANDVNEKLDKLATDVSHLHSKQVKDVEELKVKLDRSLTSTAAISTQLEKHSADLLQHDERLKASDVCPDVNEKLDKLLSKQVKDVEELKAKLDRSLTSTAAISTQLEKHSADLLRHDERLTAHDVSQTDVYKLVQSIHDAQPRSRDCSDIRERGSSISGVYRVYPGSNDKRIECDVYCDFSNVGQSWLVFQRRKDGSVNFERLWTEYERGFGDLTGEFWLGNEKLSSLTLNRKYKLRVELEDFAGQTSYAEYSIFSVQSGDDKYRLTVGGYSGTAGDSLIKTHNGMKFTTRDSDNDAASGNCAQTYRGAWWYSGCHSSNLNGAYLNGNHTSSADGVNWASWRGWHYSVKMTEMKIMAI